MPSRSTICHVAGLTIDYDGRTIQRCAICGYILCDSKDTASPIALQGPYPTWPIGRLIRIHEGNPTHLQLLPEADQLPEDNCWPLVE